MISDVNKSLKLIRWNIKGLNNCGIVFLQETDLKEKSSSILLKGWTAFAWPSIIGSSIIEAIILNKHLHVTVHA